MEKYTKTTICQLRTGDRFYMRDDASKKIWTKVDHQSDLSHLHHHKDWALRDAGRYPLAVKPATTVIFLRHVSSELVDAGHLAWK